MIRNIFKKTKKKSKYLEEIVVYIQKNLIDVFDYVHYSKMLQSFYPESKDLSNTTNEIIKEINENSDPSSIRITFSEYLFDYIDKHEIDEVKLYKRAQIDRKLFSKIRQKDYHPQKKTAILLALSAKMNLDDTSVLLKKAGYALSNSIIEDIVVRWFIEHQIYDLFHINNALYELELKTLF